MSGAAVIMAAGGYNPRQWTAFNVSLVIADGDPGATILFEIDGLGQLWKQERFTTTFLFPQWAGQPVAFDTGADAGEQFEVRVTLNSGTAPTLFSSAALGVWLPLTLGHFWGWERSTPGIETANLLMEIRSAASGQVIANGSFLTTLQVTP